MWQYSRVLTGQVLEVHSAPQHSYLQSTQPISGEKTATGYRFKPDDLAAPQDPYAISKWEAENELLEISKKVGLEVVIIRSPIVYGPDVKGNFAFLLHWINRGFPLPLGAINNCRSMLALENLVSFIALCVDIEVSPNAKNQIFLVSDGEDVSTSELVYKIRKAYGCNSKIFPFPVRVIRFAARLINRSFADRLLESLLIDGSKAREMVGWKPPFTMDEQLKKMAIYDSSI